MTRTGAAIFLLAVVCCQLVSSFNLERDLVGKSRSKRQLKRVCSSELYEKPLNTVCNIPPAFSHHDAVKKCCIAQKAANLSVSENVCTFDCVYQAKKYISATGVLDLKVIATDFGKGLDSLWVQTVGNAMKTCHSNVTKLANVKPASGYATKCKTVAFAFQTCVMVQLYNNCPTSKRAATYSTGKTALMACDPFLVYKSTAEAAKNAMTAMKSVDVKSIGGMLAAAQNPGALSALAAKGFTLPPGMNAAEFLAKAKANPLLALKTLPANFNPSMLAGLMG